MKVNPILNTDSYKASQFVQYPPGTTEVYSYIEARKENSETVFFGLQAFLKEYLSEPITAADIDEAEAIWLAHGEPFNRKGWEYILNKHKGFMPVVIYAVPEGTVVPTQNVLVAIRNTDPECFWLTSYLETSLLRAIWYPTTVATESRRIKKLIEGYMVRTGSDLAGLPFKLHDFGARGVSSYESSMLGGMAHLVNFMGTDTIAAVMGAKEYYQEAGMPAFSVPASEHSTMTSWGRDHEEDAYRNMLKQFGKPGAIVSVVSDSYDIYHAVENLWGDKLRQEVLDSGAMLVVRPDSGDPVQVVTRVVDLLDQKFGHTLTNTGHKLLKNVRVLQGDGINYNTIAHILDRLDRMGYAADNMVFGMGGALLQGHMRDDLKFAMKCSSVMVDGLYRDVVKDPVTDSGKKSKGGRVSLVRDKEGRFQTIHNLCISDVFRPVYYEGAMINPTTFTEIRVKAK
jgi:nicotinamide phosphoribosyltransferase